MLRPFIRPFASVTFGLLFLTACPQSKQAETTCRPKEGERPAKAVLRCTQDSVAYVKTEAASGTGVVIELSGKSYLITNEHVVDPFDSADVTLGERSFEELPVVGIDAAADIAILGPLPEKDLPAPLTITDGVDLERGDELFLVGFPGETEAENIEVTIAAGIVSRVREVEEFGHTYIQTDASIGGGQSGGPLFDSSAQLVGISGLSFAEDFALALSGKNVTAAAKRIVDGKGDEYLGLPSAARPGAGSTAGELEIFDASDGQVLFLPEQPESVDWHLTVDMSQRPVVSVSKLKQDEPLAVSSNATEIEAELGRQLATARGGRPEDLPDFSAGGVEPRLAERETAPGKFTIPVKAEESALVFVAAPLIDAPIKVAWESNLSLSQASRKVTEETLQLGSQVDRVFGTFDTALDLLIDLEEGQKIQLHARSPQGDPAFTLIQPGKSLDHLTILDPEGAGAEVFDDTDDGLYGIDAKTTYEVKGTGRYRIRLFSNDLNTTFVRFSATDCVKINCD